MLCPAFLDSLLTAASMQRFGFSTKLQLIISNRKIVKNSVYIQKDRENLHIPSHARPERKWRLNTPSVRKVEHSLYAAPGLLTTRSEGRDLWSLRCKPLSAECPISEAALAVTHHVRALHIQAAPRTPWSVEGVYARFYVFPPCVTPTLLLLKAHFAEVTAPLRAI